MGNIFASLFNFGGSTQIENTIINAQIDTLIKRIKKDFFNGDFTQAFETLDSSLSENTNNSNATYKLLLVKLEFLIDCRQFDDATDLIKVLEKEGKDSLKLKESKLTLLSINQDENFFNLAEELRVKTPNSKPKGHFDILYYLNTKEFEKAKKIFEEEIKNSQYESELYLVGGHIYSNDYRYLDSDIDNFNNADKYYKLALEKNKLSFLDKFQIDGFYATYFMNNQLRDKITLDETLKESLKVYKSSLNIVLDNKKYFEDNYIESLIDNYFYALVCLGLEEEYITFYSLNEISNLRHYLTCCDLKTSEIDHGKCQEIIKVNQNLDDILVYVSLLIDKEDTDKEIVLDFFQKNEDLIFKNEFIIYTYIKGLIHFRREIDTKIIDFIKDKKYEKLEYILAFFEASLYASSQITTEDIDELYNKSFDDNLTFMRLFQIITLLKRLKEQKKYLQIVIEKQNLFKSLVSKVLEEVCKEDKDLLLPDYNEFVEQINDKNKYAGLIGNVYSQHDDLNNALKYYYIQFKSNPDIGIVSGRIQFGHRTHSHLAT